MIKGVDVSKYQYPIDFKKLKSAEIEFVILRAAFSTTQDKYLSTFYPEAINAGIIKGAYHFVDYTKTGTSQGKVFANIFNKYPCEMGAWCDLEYYVQFGDFTRKAMLSWLYDYFSAFEGETGRSLGIYVNADMVINRLAPIPEWLLSRDLWIAHWNVTKPNIGAWSKYILWQTETKTIDPATYGVASKELDMDVFNGTLVDLKKYCKITESVTENVTETVTNTTANFFDLSDADKFAYLYNHVTQLEQS